MGITKGGETFTGAAAWQQYYGGNWGDMKLGDKVGAFVEGGANMITALGMPLDLAVGIIAVMVACFAATTLDTATRLQRYVLQEIGETLKIKPLCNKYVATLVAVVTGGAMALLSGPHGPGSGGLILWPLFGSINQLLAGLAFLVVAFYLIRTKRPVWFLVVPMILMIVFPAWAMTVQLTGFYAKGQWLLFCIGLCLEVLQVWMVFEAVIMWKKAKGVLPEPLPSLAPSPVANEGGRSC
jgi:carbon starvation protein